MTAAVRVSELNELLTLTPDDLFLVSDVEQDSSNKVKFSSLQSNLTLGGLADVSNFSNIQSGQVLQWNGTEFVPFTVSSTVVDGDGNVVVDLGPINDALTKIHTKLGVSSSDVDLGNFDGTDLPDNSDIKTILGTIENKFELISAEFAADEAEILAVEQDLDEVNTNLNLTILNLNTLTTDIDNAGYLTGIPGEYITSTELQTEISSLTLAGIAGISGTPGLNQIIKWNGTSWIFAPDIDTDTDTNVNLAGYATEAWVQSQGYSTGGGGGGITLADVANDGYIKLTDVASAGYLTSFDVSDGDSVNIGDDVDLKLYFDSSIGVQTSFIESDALIIRAKSGSNDPYITFLEGGPVELYYDGVKKLSTGSDGVGIQGNLEVDKVYFKNVFSNLSDLPSASTYHGMFAHVHNTGAAYYAHGGNWIQLANDSDIPSLTGYATESYVNTQISNVSVPSNLVDLSDVFIPSVNNGEVLTYNSSTSGWVPQPLPSGVSDIGDLGDVSISGTPTTGHVLKWDGSSWAPASDSGGGSGGGISLNDLSVTVGANSGSGNLGYNDVTGIFTFTPVDLTGYYTKAEIDSANYSSTLLGLADVDSTDTPAGDDVLVYSAADSEFKLENLTSVVSSLALQNIADAGYGVDVTGKIATTDGIDIDLGGSINAAGTSIDFQNTTISFSGANIGGLSPSDVNLDNISNAAYGVDVTGKIATTDGIDIGSGGNINAALTSIDFQGATINFGSAIITGLGPEIRGTVDTHLNQSTATDGQVLAWDTSANAGNGDYVWSTPATGGGVGTSITLADNTSSAFSFLENTTPYLIFNTTNNGEKIQILKDLWVSDGIHTAGDIVMDGNSTVKFNETSLNGQNYVGLKAPANLTSDVTFILPGTDGTNGQVLTTDGSGNFGWATPSSGGGGGATTLDGLSDVATVGATSGQVLKYNGSSWAPADDVDTDTDTNVDLTTVNTTLTQLSEFNQNLINETAVSGLDFTSNNTTGSSPMSVSLTASYAGDANRFDVDWGDGTQNVDLTINQLNHTYNNSSGGQFDITVTAKNTNGVGFGSTSIEGKTNYITLYTPAVTVDFGFYSTNTGGSELTGNNLYYLLGTNVWLGNQTLNASGVNARFALDWGDNTDLIQSDGAQGGVDGPRTSHTYNTDPGNGGMTTIELKITDHDTADPSTIPTSTTKQIKLYDPNVAAPTGLSNKLNDVGGSTALLASGFTDNTGGTKSAGDSVRRLTSGSAQTSMSSFAYNAESGTLRSIRNGITTGQIFMSQPHNQYLTDGDLALNGESDYNLLTSSGGSTSFSSSTFYPGLYKGFKARTVTNYASADAGLNEVKLTHSETGDSNERYFVKDTTTTPNMDVSSATVTEIVSGAKKFISGIPYYSNTNSTISVQGAVVNNLTTECYTSSSPLNVTSDSVSQGGSNNPVSNVTYNYVQCEGASPLLSGSIPLANVTGYALGNLNVNPANNAYGSRKLRVRARNINNYGSYVTLPTIIQTFTRDQNVMDIDEQDINVSASLGNGSYTDGGVRILDFIADTVDTPTINSAVDYYTHNVYSESVDPMVSGSREASLIYGDVQHNTIDYSTGYLPVGPDRSGDTGTQYFTFAFRRQVVANFSIRINTGGIAGCWIAAPGTAIDASSGINGWLDTSQAYAGSGVPGSNTGNGGNGSDGCATNNSSRISINTSINGTYTMTLGEENMSNATGNVVLVRIALNSGQSISTLEVN